MSAPEERIESCDWSKLSCWPLLPWPLTPALTTSRIWEPTIPHSHIPRLSTKQKPPRKQAILSVRQRSETGTAFGSPGDKPRGFVSLELAVADNQAFRAQREGVA